MDQGMITFGTEIKVSHQRFNEIFDVPATKEVLNQLFEKAENVEKMDLLLMEYKKCYEGLPEEISGVTADTLDEEFKEEVKHLIKMHILNNSFSRIIEGTSVDESVQLEIKNQLDTGLVFEDVSEYLENINCETAILKLIVPYLIDDMTS